MLATEGWLSASVAKLWLFRVGYGCGTEVGPC